MLGRIAGATGRRNRLERHGAAPPRCSTLGVMSKASVEAQRQLDRIVALGYPDVADVSAAAFRSLARPLIEALEHTDFDERILLAPTLEEGLAIATQHPGWLQEKNGFNLLGSRSADGRVPSIWLSQNAPRLGAVWPNSKHTWLGNAFCMARRGVSLFR